MNKELDKEFENALDASRLVFEVLREDRKVLFEYVAEERNKQFWCRTYTRFLFADLETRSYQLRRMMLLWHRMGIGGIQPEEAQFLEELSYRMNDKGEVQSVGAKIKTASSFLFTFKMFSKVSGHDVDIDTGQVGWANFKKALTIRDRITHPRIIEDLSISNDEITDVIKVGYWIDDQFRGLMAKMDDVLKKLVELGYLTMHDKD